MENIRFSLLKYAVTAFSMVLLWACQTPEPPDTLSVSPTRFTFVADDTKEEVAAVTTNVTTWSVEAPDSWVITRKENDELRISVQNYNGTDEPRTADVTIIAGTADAVTIKVTQTARNSLSVSPESLSFDADETGSRTINVSTNASSWDATTGDSWISLNKQGNTLTVGVSSGNTGSSPRTATIKITAGSAAEKTVTVTQAEGTVSYINAEGFYLGNKLGTGTAHFAVDFYNYDSNVGLFISGFCTLPSGFNNFKLTTGTYNLSNSGAVRTFLTGTVNSETSVGGTVVYNFNTKKFTLITGGTFTVESSGNNYTITTNFTGIDHTTGATVDNIRAKYSGPIEFTCEWGCESVCTPSFGSFCESNFTTSGTWINTGLPTSWSGVITPRTTTSNLNYYNISKWGGSTYSVFCDYKNGKITIDNYSKIFSEDGSDYYFNALAIDQTQMTAEIVPNWEAKYNASTKTLDFSGSYNGYPVAVGIVAETSSGFSIFHGYFNLKIVLTSTSSEPMPTEGFSLKMKASPDAGNNKENFLKGNMLRIDGASAVTLKKASLSKTNPK